MFEFLVEIVFCFEFSLDDMLSFRIAFWQLEAGQFVFVGTLFRSFLLQRVQVQTGLVSSPQILFFSDPFQHGRVVKFLMESKTVLKEFVDVVLFRSHFLYHFVKFDLLFGQVGLQVEMRGRSFFLGGVGDRD